VGGASQLAAHHVQNLTFQANDLVVGLFSGQKPMTVFMQQGAQIGQIMQQSGLGVRGFLSELARMAGIIKVTQDATAAADAAAAAGAAKAIAAVAERATANIAAADTELELALAQVRTAEGSKALAAAQARLAAAHEAVAAAAGEAAIAENALSVAQGRAAEASSAAAATRVTSLGRVGAVAIPLAAAAVGAAYGFHLLGEEMGKNAHLDAYAKKLGLTTEEIKKAGGATVTLGDIVKGTWAAIVDATGLDKGLKNINKMFLDVFKNILRAAGEAAVEIYAELAAVWDTLVELWNKFPAIMKAVWNKVANFAIEAAETFTNANLKALNLIVDGINTVLGTKLGHFDPVHLDRVKEDAGAAGDAAGISYTKHYNARRAEGMKVLQAAEDSLEAHILKAAQDRLKAEQDADKKKGKGRTDQLQKEIESMEAAIKAQWALAAAYDLGDAAAMRAAAAEKAHEQAIRKKGDFQVFYALQLRKMVADAAVDAAKQANDLRFEGEAQEALNKAIRDGTIAYSQSADFLKKHANARQIEAAMVNATVEEYPKLEQELANLEGQYNRSARARANFQALGDIQKGKDEIARLEKELELVGKTNEERERELAILAVRQRYAGTGISDANLQTIIDQEAKRVHLQTQLNSAKSDEMKLYDRQLDQLDALAQRAQSIGTILADAFGRPGQAIANLLVEFTDYADKQLALERDLAKKKEELGATNADYLREEARVRNIMAANEIEHWGNALSAAKGFFKEGSTGYKAMATLEKVYSALQLANMIKAMVIDKASTASSVANSAVRGTADAAAGAAKIFASLGPLGFPVVAAMVAVLASLGLKGLHGGGHGPSIPTAEDVQKAQGTGTVLGDSSAKSDSIAKSLALVEAHTNKDLEYSSEMVRSLRAIEGNIGSLAAQIAQQMNLSGGGFDTSGLRLGTTTGTGAGKYLLGGLGALAGLMTFSGPIGLIGGAIGVLATKIPVIGDVVGGILHALFGTKKTVSLIDQGFQFTAQSVGEIVNSGVIGDIYNQLQTVKKSKFLGLSTGTKTSYSTQTSPLDSDFTNQIGLLIGSLRDGIVSAAKVIGVDGAEAMIDAFQLDLGRISTKDLKGDDLEKAIAAIFSKAADDMAEAVAPGLSQFQKVGEGLFETLTRLARDYQVVDVTLQSIGKVLGSVGAASVGARESLIDYFGGLDNFTELHNQFAQDFLSEAERMAPVQAAVAKAMADLGLAGIATKDQFKQTVLGLDLTTEAGQQMYAQLLAIAPEFAKVQDYLAKLNGTVADTAKTAEQLAQIEKQRRSMEIQLMDLTGHSAEALAARRADEIAALDESLRPLQEQIYAAQDAADAAKALADAQAEAARVADEAARQAEAIANEHRSLEIRLAEALGDAAGALAMKRADELAAMNEQNRALAEAVFAAEDAAAAQETLNSVHMTAAELAKTQRELEIRLMEASGDAASALAAKRADEMAAMDETLRPLLALIYAAEDAASATEALGKVTQTAAEIAKTRHDLELRLMEVQGRNADLLAARRADEMAATDASLQGMLAQIYAAEDAKAAAEALAQAQADEARAAEEAAHQAAELARTHRDLEIRLMEAQGDAAGALAARRADELAAVDDVGKALLQMIYTAEDAAAAGEALNKVTQTTAEIAKTRRDLEIQLLDATGHSVEALAARRADELAALDATLQPLQETVWAALDAADAQKKLADAQEEAARRAEDIAKQRAGLEIDLMRALGDEAGALAAERALQLAGTDDSLKALQQQVWAAQDAAAAQQALADAQAASARAAEEAAQAQQALADKRTDLEIRLLRATGNEIGAVAMERARELDQLDPSLRSLQQQVYAAEDAKKAIDDQNKSISDTVSKYRGLADGLREYRTSLAGAAALTTEEAYRAAANQFGAVYAKARGGDTDALGSLGSAGDKFLSAARDNASSALEYKRSVAFVASAVDDAIKVAEGKASEAEQQLALGGQQLDMLITINGTMMSVHDAIITAADRGAPIPAPTSPTYASPNPSNDNAELLAEIKALRAEMVPPTVAAAVALKRIDNRTEAQDDAGYVRVSSDGQALEVDTGA
jgi:hypothetical protein